MCIIKKIIKAEMREFLCLVPIVNIFFMFNVLSYDAIVTL